MMVQDVIDTLDSMMRDLIQEAKEVTPEDLGLDRRAAYRLWVTDEGIIAAARDDRVLQYYGGFEYVDKACRVELGDWVFYSANDDRVAGHLEQLEEDV